MAVLAILKQKPASSRDEISEAFVRNGGVILKTYDAGRADIMPCDVAASAIMRRNPAEIMKSLLSRIGVEYVDGLPKEAYLSAFLDEFCGGGEWILKILPGDALRLLLGIWEKDQVELDEQQWGYMQYLNMFGFVSFSKGNPISGQPNVVRYTAEMKNRFYFHLKSRKSRRMMDDYTEWEKIIAGLLCYYGMIEFRLLHESFMKTASRNISYEEFISFIKCRCTLWPLVLMLRDTQGGKEYFQNVNVENPEFILIYREEHRDMPYKCPAKEDLIYVSEGSGIDNRWRGVSELGTLFVDEMKMDYYQATVLVRTLIDQIQNSGEEEEVRKKIKGLPFAGNEQEDRALEAVSFLYDSVPVYELKGYSRAEYRKIFYQKQLKKKKGCLQL